METLKIDLQALYLDCEKKISEYLESVLLSIKPEQTSLDLQFKRDLEKF